MSNRRTGAISVALLLFLAAAAAAGLFAWSRLGRTEEARYESAEEAFKYGSIGNIDAQGMPYYIWMVLPRVFGEYLPGNGGYASFGFVSEPGHELPVGFARVTKGFPRVAFNCALCHAGSFRETAAAAPTVVAAAPGHRANPQAYLQFLFRCASDPRFDADVLLAEIRQNVSLSPLDEGLYRYVLIPATRKALLAQRDASAWMWTKPAWGPGRIDPFNPVKFGLLGMPVDGTIGNADNMAIWSLRSRAGQRLHWDGMNRSVHEVVLTSALGDGATLGSLDLGKLGALEAWLQDVQPPAYPKPIDQELAREGQAVFARACHDCHGSGGPTTGEVVPLAEIGTDSHRHALWSGEAAARYNAYAKDYPFKFDGFVGTNGDRDGYTSAPLTGLWLRGPYLHNGSVPSLEDLLAEPFDDEVSAELTAIPRELSELSPRALDTHVADLRRIGDHVRTARERGRRPAIFLRGSDVLDPTHVGFVSDVASLGEEVRPFVFDTRVAGNGNGGHAGPRYGTTLAAHEKTALIEYLKTL